MRTNSRQILAFLRNGDFAHPGSIEAIEMAMTPIIKNPNQYLVDVGCGLGGTAHYLHEKGWGNIIGIDIDKEMISYAKQKYTQISFLEGDVINSPQLLAHKKVNVFYFFNSYYCFPFQEQSLKAIAQNAEKNCQLMIFDYCRFSSSFIENPFYWQKFKEFNPIYLKTFKEMLERSGWKYKKSIDISEHFKQWYTDLLYQFELKQEELHQQFNPELCKKMFESYTHLLRKIEAQKLGGIIVYASL